MKKHPVGELEKRHIRNLEHKHREQMDQLRQSTETRVSAAERASYGRGYGQGERDKTAMIPGILKEAEAKAHAAGVKQGAAETLEALLRHSGRLFQERKDNDANAVREVHRLLGGAPAPAVAAAK